MSTAEMIRRKYNLPEGCPTESPWGVVQHGEKVTDGLFSVSTSSHGGYKVYDDLNQIIPEAFRHKGGWYEEDVDYNIVHFFLPFFSPEKVEEAKKTLMDWRWQQWEAYFEVEVPVSQSRHKAEYLFQQEHKNDYLTISAFGDWHRNVPKGMVGVIASKGGLRGGFYRLSGEDVARWHKPEEACFLVTEEEYATRTNNPSGSLVIDPSKHQTWVGPYA